MGRPVEVPFLGGVGPGRSVAANPLRRLNWFTEIEKDTGLKTLQITPGMTLFAANGNNQSRGEHQLDDYLYVVQAGTFYEVNNAGVFTSRGTLNTTSGRVTMADNGTQIVIVDGTDMYVYVPATNAYSTLGSPASTYHASIVIYANGYFAVPKADSGEWYISALGDGLTWDSLDFADAETFPDNLESMIADNGQVWLFGGYSTEVWYNSGDADFPFRIISGSNIEWGIKAKYSVAKVDNRLVWLANPPGGGGPVVVRNNGFNVERISTHAIEYLIGQYTTIGDAFAFSYAEEGHYFYVLTFPTGNATFVWDSATGEWHERSSSPIGVGRYRANSYAYYIGQHIVGDYQTGNLYRMKLGVYDENGETIRSEIRVKINEHRQNYVKHKMLQVEFQTGVGLSTGQGSDPQAMLDWSDDGGFTWSNEHWRSLGAIGNYLTRVIWRRLGMSRDRVYRLAVTDPVQRTILGASLEVEVENA